MSEAWLRNAETPSPTGATSPSRPSERRLMRATTTPRTAASGSASSQRVNSGSGLEHGQWAGCRHRDAVFNHDFDLLVNGLAGVLYRFVQRATNRLAFGQL